MATNLQCIFIYIDKSVKITIIFVLKWDPMNAKPIKINHVYFLGTFYLIQTKTELKLIETKSHIHTNRARNENEWKIKSFT